MSSTKGKTKLSRIVNWVILLSAGIICLIYFQDIFKPFLLAMVFWYLLMDARNQLSRIRFLREHLPRWLRTTLTFILFLLLLELASEILTRNVEQIIDKIPNYTEAQTNLIDKFGKNIGIPDLQSTIQKQIGSIDAGKYLTRFLNSLTSALGDIILVIAYIIFLFIEEAGFSRKINRIINSGTGYVNTPDILEQINGAINKYLTVKTLLSLAAGAGCYIILILFKVDFPFLWAFITFIFNFIPYIGALLATLLPASYAIFQFGSVLNAFWLFLTLEALHSLIGNYFEPKYYGQSLNLSPLAVVLSLTFWGSIWGILGMLISVPIMSVIAIIMAQFPETRFLAILLSEKGNIESLIINTNKNKEENTPETSQ